MAQSDRSERLERSKRQQSRAQSLLERLGVNTRGMSKKEEKTLEKIITDPIPYTKKENPLKNLMGLTKEQKEERWRKAREADKRKEEFYQKSLEENLSPEERYKKNAEEFSLKEIKERKKLEEEAFRKRQDRKKALEKESKESFPPEEKYIESENEEIQAEDDEEENQNVAEKIKIPTTTEDLRNELLQFLNNANSSGQRWTPKNIEQLVKRFEDSISQKFKDAQQQQSRQQETLTDAEKEQMAAAMAQGIPASLIKKGGGIDTLVRKVLGQMEEPYVRYPYARRAKETPTQILARDEIEKLVESPFYRDAQDRSLSDLRSARNPIFKEEIESNLNPYNELVIEKLKKDKLRDFKEYVEPYIEATYGGRGRKSSSFIKAREKAMENYQRDLNESIGAMRAKFAEDARNFAFNQRRFKTLNAESESERIKDMMDQRLRMQQVLANLGRDEQARIQQQLDTQYADFQRQMEYPYSQINRAAEIFRGFPVQTRLYPFQGPTMFNQGPSIPYSLGSMGLGYLGDQMRPQGYARGGRVNFNDGGSNSEYREKLLQAAQILENTGVNPIGSLIKGIGVGLLSSPNAGMGLRAALPGAIAQGFNTMDADRNQVASNRNRALEFRKLYEQSLADQEDREFQRENRDLNREIKQIQLETMKKNLNAPAKMPETMESKLQFEKEKLKLKNDTQIAKEIHDSHRALNQQIRIYDDLSKLKPLGTGVLGKKALGRLKEYVGFDAPELYDAKAIEEITFGLAAEKSKALRPISNTEFGKAEAVQPNVGDTKKTYKANIKRGLKKAFKDRLAVSILENYGSEKGTYDGGEDYVDSLYSFINVLPASYDKYLEKSDRKRDFKEVLKKTLDDENIPITPYSLNKMVEYAKQIHSIDNS